MNQDQPQHRVPIIFPIYVVVEDNADVLPMAECKIVRKSDLPKEGTFFAITQDRCWQHTSGQIVSGLTTVKEIGCLAKSLPQHVNVSLPKIPPIIIARAWEFFRTVYNEYKAESEVMVLYNPNTEEYDLWCPQQEVAHSGVWYELKDEALGYKEDLEGDWKFVGTIHSHCDFSAFHSGTDTADERYQNGIHITLGHVNQSRCSVVSSLVLNGHRWQVSPDNCVHGLDPISEPKGRGKTRKNRIYVSSSQFYSVRLDEEDKALLTSVYYPQIAEQWMSRVAERTFRAMAGWRQVGHKWVYSGVPQDEDEFGLQGLQVEEEQEEQEEQEERFPHLSNFNADASRSASVKATQRVSSQLGAKPPQRAVIHDINLSDEDVLGEGLID